MALGVGLLIGAERERRKQERPSPSAAGIRTFAVATLAGAVALLVGGVLLLAVVTAATASFAALAYWRAQGEDDPGVTTEIALVLAVLVGALAVPQPMIAAGVGVVVAILLAARTPLHHFVGSVLTGDEVRSGLLLAGATLVVLPLLPDRAMGPYQALNPRAVWLVVILLLAISAAGHVAIRTLGVRFGLPLAGLAGGFVSSTATIGAMSARAGKTPSLLAGAVAGAVLSTVATIAQLAVLLAALSPPTLRAMAAPLACAGLAAGAYGALFTLKAFRQPPDEEHADPGQAFSLTSALTFAGMLAVILVVSAALSDRFGGAGAAVGAAAAGLVDAHAAAISMASLVASGHMDPRAAVLPILLGLTSNTLTKVVFALSGGQRAFVWRVVPGLLLVAAAAWLGSLVQTALGW
ncbi:MAG: MgtC/SapB family protein [Phenylobacterium sp.]|nr:MgtC/SapB family protein [Phenylobacterium sp.]